jgi:rhamnulose-1-phosphate aldolase
MIESGSGYKATMHTHPIELVAMSHSNEWLDSEHLTQVLWSMIPETLAFAPLGIGVVPYAMPSSVELADPTLQLIKKHDVVLWEKHGTIAVGPDMMEAFDQTDVLNKAAAIYMTAKNFGFTADGMTPEAVQKIRTVFNLPDKR